MKQMILPLGALLFVIACGDDSSSAIYEWAENRSSSTEPAEESSSSLTPLSSSRNDVNSSSSEEHSSSSIVVSSSSSWNEVIGSSSSSLNSISSSSMKNDESSSSVELSSSSKEVSSSSVAQFSSSSWITSSSSSLSSNSSSSRNDVSSSSSEILTDPSKIFEIRKPKHDAFTCEVPWGGEGEFMRDTLSQHDVICTYDYNGEKGFLYVQLTPISCGGGMSITPGSYNVDKAEFYINGKFADVSNVKYEWGGNHHVEKLMFTYKDKVFRYGQSTMGWGGRPCQNMDCLKVFESDGKTYVENGCNERSLPIVCRNVNGNGEIVCDFTDKYEVCEGDPRTLGYEVEY